MASTALVAGASGLVGKELLKILINSSRFDEVISVGRSSLHLTHPKYKEIIVDMRQLEMVVLPPINSVFCCLGTTIKKAKTKENFELVDVDFVVALGLTGRKHGAQSMLVVSAVGANVDSSIFYNRTKGKMEQKIGQLGFKHTYFFRPSMLGGKRDEFRFGERLGTFIMKALSIFFVGALKRYKIISAEKVAQAMISEAINPLEGVHHIESEQIQTYTEST